LPDPHELYGLSWDTETTRRQRFRLADFEGLRGSTPHFASLAAGQQVTVMQDGVSLPGLLVTGDYFSLICTPRPNTHDLTGGAMSYKM
jgi:hypothetical protein